jgi:hypothetical protein
MLVYASRTLLEILEPTAVGGNSRDTLRTAQASLPGELHGAAAGTLGQSLLRWGLRRHNEAVGKLEMCRIYEEPRSQAGRDRAVSVNEVRFGKAEELSYSRAGCGVHHSIH